MEEGVFCKKVENGGCFCKKKCTFPQCRVHYVQYQYFLFYILFIWGCIPNAPTGLDKHIICFIIDGKHGYALCFTTCQG